MFSLSMMMGGAFASRNKPKKQLLFSSVYQCSSEGREKQTVVSDLDGTLLRGSSSFPYFMLLAFEAPAGVVRFATLLLLSPVAWLCYHFVSEATAIKLLIFVSCAGVREADIVSVARAVLPKFYAEDLHPETWRVFSSFGKRFILTANPRILIEPFAKEYLGVDAVMGSELEISKAGRATGFVKSPGVMVGENKGTALKKQFAAELPDVGLGDRTSDYPFLAMCKDGYIVPGFPKEDPLPQSKLPKPLIFHDGRLVKKPTPLQALVILLWLPLGFILSLIRVGICSSLPMSISYYALRILGVRMIVKGTPPTSMKEGAKHGALFVCNHKTLLDPVFVSCALGRPITAVTYSLSRVSEFISPIPTVRLSRDKGKDAANMQTLLREGDLVICPEGTTCREPFLLRFSALFAELAYNIVPVATNSKMGMFHATTARGFKGMDCFYYFMNPSPVYEVTFLKELPKDLTCAGPRTPYEVANYVQSILGATLNFECTTFTRKDKYKALAGNDGNIPCNENATRIIA